MWLLPHNIQKCHLTGALNEYLLNGNRENSIIIRLPQFLFLRLLNRRVDRQVDRFEFLNWLCQNLILFFKLEYHWLSFLIKSECDGFLFINKSFRYFLSMDSARGEGSSFASLWLVGRLVRACKCAVCGGGWFSTAPLRRKERGEKNKKPLLRGFELLIFWCV